jgi:hypothetical protein
MILEGLGGGIGRGFYQFSCLILGSEPAGRRLAASGALVERIPRALCPGNQYED